VKRTCKQCDGDFRVDILEQEWCRTQGLSLPRHCLPCRATRRQLTDIEEGCASCDTLYRLPADCVFLASLLSWSGPYQCEDCSTDAPPADLSRQLWELNARLRAPIEDDTAADDRGPSLPEDLFKDLDNVAPVPRVASPPEGESDAKEGRSAADGVGLPPAITPTSSENVPSPDDLFKSLAGPNRRSG